MTGLGNRESLEVLNDKKLILNAHAHAHLGPIWYHSEPSDVPRPVIGHELFLPFLTANWL